MRFICLVFDNLGGFDSKSALYDSIVYIDFILYILIVFNLHYINM
jgi:hypothetical protein